MLALELPIPALCSNTKAPFSTNSHRSAIAVSGHSLARNNRSHRQLEEHDGRVAAAPDPLKPHRGVELSGLVAIFNAEAQRAPSPLARSCDERLEQPAADATPALRCDHSHA